MATEAEQSPVRLTGHLVFGIVIIIVGVLFTLDNLDLIESDVYLRYWPLGLVAVGIAKLLEARRTNAGLLGGALFVLAGSWLLLDNLGYIDAHLFDFWPVVLVIAGAMIVWHGLQGRPTPRRPDGATDESATIQGIAILSGVTRGSNSSAFRGGELTAFMGGCEIDLRQAAINGEAVLDVFAMWGGIDIKVPENWTVISRVTPLLGGFEDHTRPPQNTDQHRLIIRGVVVMGGIDIKN
jgi:predicted membrane protein